VKCNRLKNELFYFFVRISNCNASRDIRNISAVTLFTFFYDNSVFHMFVLNSLVRIA